MDMKRKTSELWVFFEPVNRDIALCNFCNTKLSYKGSSSNLKKHLQRKHPTISIPFPTSKPHAECINQSVRMFQETPIIIEDVFRSDANVNNAASTSMDPNSSISIVNNHDSIIPLTPRKQQSLISSYSFKNMTGKEKQKIDNAVVKMFAWDFQPFTMVEDKGFQNLLNILAPSYKIPSRKYFANTMIPALYEEARSSLKSVLKDTALSVCLTIESWTSSVNDSYIAISAHYINEDFQLQTVLLECIQFKEIHTATNIAEEILRIVSEWGLSKMISIVVTDNAGNMINAVANILKLRHCGCYAHNLNLIVQDSFTPVKDILKKVKTIITYFKRSNAAAQSLIEYQVQTGVHQPKKLLQDVVTCWNSTYFMLQRFIELEEAVKYSLSLSHSGVCLLTSDEWDACKELCSILEPLAEATKVMGSENYVTGSKVIPLTRGLSSALKKLSFKLTKDIVKNVAIKLQEGISIRFSNLENNKLFSLCTFLDPQYKQHMFNMSSTVETTKNYAINLVADLINEKNKELTSNEDEGSQFHPQNEKHLTVSIWDEIDEAINKIRPKGNAKLEAIQEIQRYCDDTPITRNKNSLEWWRNHRYVYPNLAYIARKNLNVVATSVPCERIFSKTGTILSDRRSHLTNKKVKELAFLNTNLK